MDASIRPTQPVLVDCDLRARIEGDTGWLDAELTFAAPLLDALAARLSRQAPRHARTGRPRPPARQRRGAQRKSRWWPHTHGEPVLYDVALHLGDALRPLGATGFRTIEVDAGADGKGFGLRINGVPRARGACWSSAAPPALHADDATYARSLSFARDAGFNMIRVGGGNS